MKQLIVLVSIFLICANCLAYSISKNDIDLLNNLHAAWKSKRSPSIKEYNKDIQMGYAGADISGKPTMHNHHTFA